MVETQALKRKKARALKGLEQENTFKAVALEWYDNRKDMWKPRYAEEVIKRLYEDIFPQIGMFPINDIEPPLVLDAIKKIENRGAYDLAKRQLQKCGEIFRYGIATGKAVRDPTYKLSEALKPIKTKHFSSIDVREIPDFVKVLERNDARLYQTTRHAIWMMMLTFVRTNELINATWDEIDFENKEWRIPAERMKMGKEHIVPLANQTISLLKAQKTLTGQWSHVFPSPVKPIKAISNNTILTALKRMGYAGKMTGHGFRSLAMTAIKEELNYRHEVVDRQLAHVPKSKIDRAYDRSKFLKERTKMMQDWADYLGQFK